MTKPKADLRQSPLIRRLLAFFFSLPLAVVFGTNVFLYTSPRALPSTDSQMIITYDSSSSLPPVFVYGISDWTFKTFTQWKPQTMIKPLLAGWGSFFSIVFVSLFIVWLLERTRKQKHLTTME